MESHDKLTWPLSGTRTWYQVTGSTARRAGNSVVYKVSESTDLTAPYFAVKIFLQKGETPTRRERFLAEIEIVKRLKGEAGCVELIDYGFTSDVPFYVMPFFERGSLYDAYMRGQRAPTDIAAALRLFRAAVCTVAKLHNRQPPLAVRDIKPANILLTDRGEPVVCDFGLALWADTLEEERLTTHGPIGSTGYRPPEWSDRYPPSTQTHGDIWSLGRTLWAILSGTNPPNNYESLATTDYHLRRWLPERVANAVQGIVNQCTRFNGAERPTAGELLAEVDSVINYCREAAEGPPSRRIRDDLERLAIELGGSETVATSKQKSEELQSKFDEIDQTQAMLLEALRKLLPEFERAVPSEVGRFAVFGHERTEKGHSVVATAYIVFFPAQHLLDTGSAIQRKYEFQFGLNSSQEFFWREIGPIEATEHEIDGSFINPRSLTVLASQKVGQIEALLVKHFISNIRAMLR